MCQNRVIGKDNVMPWHLPEDLKYFKRITMGHPIIMGRKTFDSIGRPLPGRKNIIVTRQPHWHAEGVNVAHSLDEALACARHATAGGSKSQAMLIGGAELYEQAMPLSDTIFLTEIHAEIEGDAFFPSFNRDLWLEVSRRSFGADKSNPYPYSFTVLQRRCLENV